MDHFVENAGASSNVSLAVFEEYLENVHLLLFDFSFLVYGHGREFIEWLSEYVLKNEKLVLVCDEFFSNYELFQKSESEKQREIAVAANRFVGMLSSKGRLVQDENLNSMEKIIERMNSLSDIAVFYADGSEAGELMKKVVSPSIKVVAVMSDGLIFCKNAAEYNDHFIRTIIRTNLESEENEATIDVEDYPDIGDALHTSEKLVCHLTKKISGGAEGNVFATDVPGCVCKIYHQDQLTLPKIKKLMLLEKFHVDYEGICWPAKRVFTEKGYPVGFLMKQASGRRMSSIFDGEDEVRAAFPSWKRLDLVKIAISIVEKIQYLHIMGVIVGDIRPQNIMIDARSNVYFIDLDSCQIGEYPSPMGDEDFTPWENQEKDFSKFFRTFYNERFSCAVLIFYVLFMGLHPYSQRNGADTIGEEIAAHSFVYPKDKNGSYDSVPIGCYSEIWNLMPLGVTDAFYGVFKEDSRLSLVEWLKVLKEYEALLIKTPRDDPLNKLGSEDVRNMTDFSNVPNYRNNIKRFNSKAIQNELSDIIGLKKNRITIFIAAAIIILLLIIIIAFAASAGWSGEAGTERIAATISYVLNSTAVLLS